MNEALLVLAFIILIEAMVEAVSWTIEDVRAKNDPEYAIAHPDRIGWNKERVLAMVLSISMCVLFQVDVFKPLGFESSVPYVACVATGIIGARGANAFHDVLKKVQAIPLPNK